MMSSGGSALKNSWVFPSPCGVKVVGNCVCGTLAVMNGKTGSVSVPLRGKGSRK